jgi:hypothetical protein
MEVIVVDNPFVDMVLELLLGGGSDTNPFTKFLKEAGRLDLGTAVPKTPDLKANPDFYTRPEVPKALVLKVRSNSDSDKFYDVTQDHQGNVYCTCTGFKYRGKCSHITKVTKAAKESTFGLGMCLRCVHFSQDEADISFRGKKACNSIYTLVCPPAGGCRHFRGIPMASMKYTTTHKAKEMPMTFPVEGVLLQTFQSRHFPEVRYEVKLKDGDMVCTCRGFQFHGNCKHVQYMKQRVGLGVISI